MEYANIKTCVNLAVTQMTVRRDQHALRCLAIYASPHNILIIGQEEVYAEYSMIVIVQVALVACSGEGTRQQDRLLALILVTVPLANFNSHKSE